MKVNSPIPMEQQNRPVLEQFAPWPVFDEGDMEAVNRVLASGKVNYWTGPEGREFETEFAGKVGVRHAIAVANGTVALELALQALDIRPGDEVITSCRTFIASASAIVMRGAVPVLADVDPESQNITAETIAPLISSRTRAIIVVHLAGWPCDMDPILALARQHKLKVIEDCAQAHGACYKGRPVGSLGDVSAFSFCQDKIMTTGGEGGMVCTDDEQIWQRAWSFKDHGRNLTKSWPPRSGIAFRWLHDSFGTNWRMTEMQAVLGRRALQKLDGWVTRRRANSELLTKMLASLSVLRTPNPGADYFHSYYKYYAFLRPEHLPPGWDRDRILEQLRNRGVPCFSGSCPELYREQAFIAAGWAPAKPLPVARRLGETSLMFLVHPTLGEKEMCLIFQNLSEVLGDG
ncbi:DegT/DnrJ/EryC1/StrS aminotransferase family protein [Desulfuromonas sp. CSMB_57]|uniref:DegT/DnrJ/EryC1/StrS family aminotransferase n=1 Tax=Desulfuromonas sp. CSMB_57 TaxID=2807629 RepID=UPI0032DF1807